MMVTHLTSLALALLAVAVRVHANFETTLDMKTFDASVCASAVCTVNGVPSDFRVTRMSLRKVSGSGSAGGSESPLVLTETQRNVNRDWYGLQANGALYTSQASLTFRMSNVEDCTSGYSCSVTVEDARGNKFVQVSDFYQKPVQAVAVSDDDLAASLDAIQKQVTALSDSVDRKIKTVDGSLRSVLFQQKIVNDANDRVEDRIAKLSTENTGAGDSQGASGTYDEIKAAVERLGNALGGDNNQPSIKANTDAIADSKADILKALNDQTVQLNRWQQQDEDQFPSAGGDIASTDCSAHDACPELQDDFSKAYNNLFTDIDQLQKSVEASAAQLSTSVPQISIPKPVSNRFTHECRRGMEATEDRVVIQPSANTWLDVPVLCDTETDGGGWIVFQRRDTGDVDFYRGWEEYKNGFGDLNGEFWLGNENLHKLTEESGMWEFRIDMGFNDVNNPVHYHFLRIDGEDNNYAIHIGQCDGLPCGSLNYHDGHQFSTFDKDNDDSDAQNLAVLYHGGWWYTTSWLSNLNGIWGKKNDRSSAAWWNLSHLDSVTFSEMKIRKVP